VLDVGCGTGATTRAIARSLHADDSCVGLDISEPMIGAARAHAAMERVPAQFIVADAETHAFEPRSFDMIVSRFGVMFFADPARAFTNLRRASTPGAQLRVLAWRGTAENPFMTTAERAAAPLLPKLPPRRRDEPGQFAFADDHRVRGILERSGWSEIDIRPVDVACAFPERDLIGYFSRLGPVGRILGAADEATRERVVAAIRPAFDPYVHGDEVLFDAACWSIGARSPTA
jgi:SAM-dependent methyltransferase